MKSLIHFIACLLISLTVWTSASAQEASDEAIMMQRAQELGTFVKTNNVQGVVDYSDDAIKDLFGEQVYFNITQMSMNSIKKSGIVFGDLIFSSPTPIIKGKNRVFRFIPKNTILIANGEKSEIKGFLLAVKNKDGVWKFIEGSGLVKRPKLGKRLYPDLPDNVKYPEVSTD